MMLENSRKIEIKNSSITILAILLLAIYFINDFLSNKQLAVAFIYVVLLGLSIYLCSKKTSFYETIYDFTVLIFLGEILKNSVPYLFMNHKWIFEMLIKQFKFSATSYIEIVLSTPYIFFYLIGVLLLLICKFAPNLCTLNALKNIFNILGKYSFVAFVIHICAGCFTEYKLIENVLFFVFMISAFWNAYTKESYETADIIKTTLLVIEIAIFILLYPNQYTSFIIKFQNTQSISWIYSVGLCIICILCILSEKIMQDIIIGFVMVGTNILFLYGRLNQIIIAPQIVVLFHIFALSFFYIIENIFCLEEKYETKSHLKVLLAFCYMIAFLLSIFINNHFTKSITILCIGLLFGVIYFGKLINVRGTIYGTIIYGSIPWILLETTINSLGKMKFSLFTVILFTILFWCSCSVALSWKDTANIKAIAFNKKDSELIINGLSVLGYLLTILMLFM